MLNTEESNSVDPNDGSVKISGQYIIGSVQSTCQFCGNETDMIAIGADSFSIRLLDEEKDELYWEAYHEFVLFYQIWNLPKEIIKSVQFAFPQFKFVENQNQWMNHCQNCNAIQSSFLDELGFSPEDSEQASKIILSYVPLTNTIQFSGQIHLHEALTEYATRKATLMKVS